MTWNIQSFELTQGSGDWRWSATPPADAAGVGVGKEGRTRTWVSAQTYPSAERAQTAASYSMARVRPAPIQGPDAMEPLVPTVDAYTLDRIDGELVMVAPPLAVAERGSRWAGNSVFGRDYVLSLLACALECGVVSAEALCGVIDASQLLAEAPQYEEVLV